MAGHSKWANIKHRKARVDAKRGKMWSKCSRAIMAAAKNGGANPEANLALRYAIDEAKAENMPKDTIENAVKKGAGLLDGQNFEAIVYEGYGPGGIAVLLEILTDNRNRTASEIRKIFEKGGGNLGASGCVAYLFEQQGQIFIQKTDDEEKLMSVALESGAQDIADGQEHWLITCPTAEFLTVKQQLNDAGFVIDSAQITMVPDNFISLEGNEAQKILKLVDALEDNDDVQKVYANYDVADEAIATA